MFTVFALSFLLVCMSVLAGPSEDSTN